IAGIDLHNPAEAVGFVGVLADVEARVVAVPVGAVVLLAHLVALLHGRQFGVLVRGGEVVLEVLLAGQIGAPGGHAVGAVTEGADGLATTGVGLGAQQGVAGGGAADGNGRAGVDAAVEAGADIELPEAVGVAVDLE